MIYLCKIFKSVYANGNRYGSIDDLTYEYSGNQVTRISDLCSGPFYQGAYHFRDGADEEVEYTYDANGNMTMDLNRGITSISYDINQRPRSVVFDSGASTSYLYSADGVKLQTRHRTPTLSPAAGMGVANESTEESVTDYCGPFIYEDGELTRINLENGYLSYRSYAGQRLEVPEYVFYLRDHLGNNRVTMSANGGIYQIDHFYPFGLPMGCSYNSSHQQWRFGGKELDRTAGLDLYDFEARAYDPSTARFTRTDDLSEKYHPISPMVFCLNNPLLLIDQDGNEVQVYATRLPGNNNSLLESATHTFIVVRNDNGEVKGYFAYGAKGSQTKAAFGFGERLQKIEYQQDIDVYSGKNTAVLKAVVTIEPPDGVTQEEFDNKVIEVANSFGNNPNILYRGDGGVATYDDTYGNCNSSTSTILLKAGVSKETIKKTKSQLPGKSWGFSTHAKPWTAEEQKKAVESNVRIIDVLNKLTDGINRLTNGLNSLGDRILKLF